MSSTTRARDLLQQPAWEASRLGQPLPGSTHAVSVALPRWQDVIGYEEKKPEVVQKMASGYPRFVIHSLVRRIGEEIGKGESCLPFPSSRAAQACAEFIQRASGAPAKVISRDPVYGVVTGEPGTAALKAFWQHTGLIVSSRQAEAFLAGKRDSEDAEAARRSLRRQIAG